MPMEIKTTEMPSREEMAQEFMNLHSDDLHYRIVTLDDVTDLLACRDEMVIEGAIKELADSWDQGIACDILRALKGKLR